MATIHHCYVPSCVNSFIEKDNIHFFTLPREINRRMQWLELISQTDLNNRLPNKIYHICEEHFPEDIKIRTANNVVTLQKGAVPSLRLPHRAKGKGDITLIVSTVSTQTYPQQITEAENISAKKILKRKINENEANSVSDSLEAIAKGTTLLYMLKKENLPYHLKQLMKAEYKGAVDGKESIFYYYWIKLCFKLYFVSPDTYTMLQSSFGLPNVLNMCKEIRVTTSMDNNYLFDILKMKVNQMTIFEKNCVINVDTMSLTPCLHYDDKEDNITGFHEVNGEQSPSPAVKAMVITIQGLFDEWKQPIGYAFLSEDSLNMKTAYWIQELLSKLSDIGLVVRIINFLTTKEAVFFQSKWVSCNAPYFFLKNNKIYLTQDPTLLNKLFHTVLLTYDFPFNKSIASSNHIVEFYNEDKKNKHRLAPNLTDLHFHIHPARSEEIEKRYATELLNTTVAAGLSAYIDNGDIHEDARSTVELIVKIAELIEVLHPNPKYDQKKGKETETKIDGDQMKSHLLAMRSYLYGEKIIKFGNIFESFLITMNAYLGLIEDLEVEMLDKPIRPVNQGYSEDFLKQINSKSVDGTQLNAQQFLKIFRNILIRNLKKPLKRQNKRESFVQFVKIVETEKLPAVDPQMLGCNNKEFRTEEDPYGDILNPRSDYKQIDKPEKHTLMYVSSYLLKKCKQFHSECQSLRDYASGIGKNITINDFSRYVQYGQKNQISLRCIPCNQFVSIVENMEEVFRNWLNKCCTNSKIEQTLFSGIKRLRFILPCPCFPLVYLIKLFIRLRISYTIRLNNREIKRKHNRFVIPLLLSM